MRSEFCLWQRVVLFLPDISSPRGIHSFNSFDSVQSSSPEPYKIIPRIEAFKMAGATWLYLAVHTSDFLFCPLSSFTLASLEALTEEIAEKGGEKTTDSRDATVRTLLKLHIECCVFIIIIRSLARSCTRIACNDNTNK